ncbi:hypothetical protein [Aquisphaera insulae]|uniref:hypothetical protein n=1 Tax=Aquisphaera insulae TaxID=2712864 RepID=UPI0013EAEF9A|nr:hypothetical protein [Aquisphaera insulae]
MTRRLEMLKAWSRSPGGGRILAFGEAAVLGLAIGIADTRIADGPSWQLPAYLVAGFVLGARHAGRAMLCWLPLGVGMYLAHVGAIGLGVKPPYVEENDRFAEICLLELVPAGLGLMAGGLARRFLAARGPFRRPGVPPVRFLPRTTRDVLVVVACLAVGLALVRRAAFPPTVYAKGFTEARFALIHERMTADKVLAILGPPLTKLRAGDGPEAWLYSDQYHDTANFDRRWVFMKDGVVESIVNDYWED